MAHTLLNYGADATTQNRKGVTPLHLAAQSGLVGIVDKMVRNSIVNNTSAELINIETNRREKPLHMTVAQGHDGCVAILLKAKAHKNTNDSRGYTPI